MGARNVLANPELPSFQGSVFAKGGLNAERLENVPITKSLPTNPETAATVCPQEIFS